MNYTKLKQLIGILEQASLILINDHKANDTDITTFLTKVLVNEIQFNILINQNLVEISTKID